MRGVFNHGQVHVIEKCSRRSTCVCILTAMPVSYSEKDLYRRRWVTPESSDDGPSGKAIEIKPDVCRVGTEIFAKMASHSQAMLKRPWHLQFLLAIMGCAFVCFGAAFSIFLAQGVTVPGVKGLLMGLGFAGGFQMVIISGSALFTEVNVSIPSFLFLLHRLGRLYGRQTEMVDICDSEKKRFRSGLRQEVVRALKFWIIVYVGNYVGALLASGLMVGSNIFKGDIRDSLNAVVTSKLSFMDDGATGWFQALASGMVANWLVGMAAYQAMSARDVFSKIFGIIFPIVMFVSLGVQHGPANMCYVSLAMWNGDVNVADAWAWNILPSSLGNLLGGMILVSLAFFTAYMTEPMHMVQLFVQVLNTEEADEDHVADLEAGSHDGHELAELKRSIDGRASQDVNAHKA